MGFLKSLGKVAKVAGKVGSAINPVHALGRNLIKNVATGQDVGDAVQNAGKSFVHDSVRGVVGAGVLGAGYLAAPVLGSALGIGGGAAGAAGAAATAGKVGGALGVAKQIGGALLTHAPAVLGAVSAVQGAKAQGKADDYMARMLEQQEREYEARAPFRDAALAQLGAPRPDLSWMGADSGNPYTARYQQQDPSAPSSSASSAPPARPAGAMSLMSLRQLGQRGQRGAQPRTQPRRMV